MWLVRFGVPIVAPEATIHGVLGGLVGGWAVLAAHRVIPRRSRRHPSTQGAALADVRPGHLHSEHVGGSEHVGAEHDPLLVGGEADVGLQAVIVLGHVHQALGAQDARLDEALILDAAIRQELGTKQVDPLAVGGARHLSGIAAVAAEQRAVARNIEVNRPLVALEVIPGPLAGFDVVPGQPEILAPRRL